MSETDHEKQMRLASELLAGRAIQIHRGAARAAVLGVNDGLVSTLCIVLAVAAAQDSAKNVLIAGFAGLVAGAFSMAAGEWISVTSQVDLFRGVLADLKSLVIEERPLLISQLEQEYMKDGLDAGTAKTAANEIAGNDVKLQHEYAQHVMGINTDELGSPWTAAFTSLALFTAGGLLALFPWFFVGGTLAIFLSIGLTALGAILVGGYVSYSSGVRLYRGAVRQLFIIAVASIVTYGIGYVFGVAIS